MAKPQLSKRDILGQLMPIMVLFLAVQLIMFSCQKPKETRDSAVILGKMRTLNTEGKDLSLNAEFQALESQVDQEVKEAKIGAEEGDKRKLEALILTADMQLKAGEFYKQTGRMVLANQSLESHRKHYATSPLWTSFEVTAPHLSTKWTPATLYQHSIDQLSDWNRRDLTYGLIPGFQVIDFLVHLTGAVPSFSYWFACFLLAFVVRAVVSPLTQRQLMWGRQMSQLQPLAKEIKEKYKDDMQQQQVKTMQLYQEYGLNPYAGCMPAFVQLPLFLTVYQFMLHYKFEFTKGTFLWINPGTAASLPAGLASYLAPNLGIQDHLLIIIYTITMMVSTYLTPVSDPSQAMQQKLMGLGISLFFGGSMFFGAFPVPSAFVLYWTFTNLLATAQSLRAYRLPLPPLQKVVVASTGGAIPTQKKGFMDKLNAMMLEAQMQANPEENKNGTSGKPTNGTAKPLDPPSNGSKSRTGNPNIRKPKKRK